jgi:hypothetical protein
MGLCFSFCFLHCYIGGFTVLSFDVLLICFSFSSLLSKMKIVNHIQFYNLTIRLVCFFRDDLIRMSDNSLQCIVFVPHEASQIHLNLFTTLRVLVSS